MLTKTQGGSMRGDELFIRMATRPPFSKLHPRMGVFFKEYLAGERAVEFHGKTVVNTHFPPWPSRAFDRLAEQFGALGDAGTRRLYSVTLAVTNRCPLHCWHCYNAGRAQTDLSLEGLKRIAVQLQDLGAIIVTLTGGEPLVRPDLEQIVAAFDDRTCLFLNTTGLGLTAQRAKLLKEAGLFAAGISLDSADEAEHDAKRGRPGRIARRSKLCASRLRRGCIRTPSRWQHASCWNQRGSMDSWTSRRMRARGKSIYSNPAPPAGWPGGTTSH